MSFGCIVYVFLLNCLECEGKVFKKWDYFWVWKWNDRYSYLMKAGSSFWTIFMECNKCLQFCALKLYKQNRTGQNSISYFHHIHADYNLLLQQEFFKPSVVHFKIEIRQFIVSLVYQHRLQTMRSNLATQRTHLPEHCLH